MTIEQIYEKYNEYYDMLKKYRQTIINNKNNYKLLLQTMDQIYKFLKDIAPTFYNTGNIINATELYHTLANEVKIIESHIPNNYFIIPSEPTFIYQKERLHKPDSNNPKELLDWLVYMARENYAYTTNTKKSIKNYLSRMNV